jgi:hypothetical protein
MLLPLGFGGRFPRFPWVTLGLCLGIYLFQAFSTHPFHMPLLANLLILFLVGSLVENRRSPILMLSIFLICGGFGIFLHSVIEPNNDLACLGTSMGAVALAGLFAAYFCKFRMRFLLFLFPPFYKSFHAHSIIILPITFFAIDLLNGFSEGDGSLYLAHMGGAFLGLSLGFTVEKFKPIQWPMLYAFEKTEMQKIDSISNPHKKIYHSLDLLKVNPENIAVIKLLCAESIHLLRSGFPCTPEHKEILTQHIPTLISVSIRKNDAHEAFSIMSQIPISVSLREILDRSSQKNIKAAIEWAQQNNHPWTLLRLYDVWLSRFALAKNVFMAQNEMIKIIEELYSNPSQHKKLRLTMNSLAHKSPLRLAILKHFETIASQSSANPESA